MVDDQQGTQTPHPFPVGGSGQVPTTLDQATPREPLLNTAGRGIVGGVPLGEQRQIEARELNRKYKFLPAALARARAATNRALGR
jgi:hypothetical protein